LLGSLDSVDLIEVPKSGNCGGGAAGRVSLERSVADLVGTREDAERGMITALAGSAALRELGLSDSGGEPDEQLAGTIALAFNDWAPDVAERMFEGCKARCEELVARPDYQHLLVSLVAHLDATPAMSGSHAAELLRGWDPKAPVFRQWDMTYDELASRYRSPTWAEQKLAHRPRDRAR
jgi:hypothetical protein